MTQATPHSAAVPSPAERWRLTTVFLDRDGTINVKAPDGEYVTRPSELRLLPGAAGAIRALHEAGLRVVVVTNQRGIALGRMTEDDLADVHAALLEQVGEWVDGIYHCPHEDGACDCRKPRPGMLEAARRDAPDIDFSRSVTIGDSATDMQAGRAVGTRLIMLGDAPAEAVDHTAASLADAVRWLLGEPEPRRRD